MANEKILVTQSSMPPYEEYIEAIKPLWESHRLTNMGTYHKELEEELKQYLGVPELSLMVNGHMALEMAIQAFDFPEDSEVITTPFTFVSTTHAIVRNRLKPVFCDVKMSDGTIDETKIEDLITEKTVAIVPVHVYGNVCNVEAIQEIADKYNLKVIYDAAHAFGVKYKGVGIGNYGDASVFSFHATKVFNTIEGGAVAFSDHKIYEKLYNLKNFGIRGEELVVAVGANAKMNEFAAIMGLCNLKYLNHAMEERKMKDAYYREKLRQIQGIQFFEDDLEIEKNHAYFPIIVSDDYSMTRDELYDRLKENNVFSRKYFYPLTSDQACFRNKYKKCELNNARWLSKHILVLPFYEKLEMENIDHIVGIMKD
ncbi:DegT/DnrJ/EryC1/StrS family aminotransferase [Waltera sp.]|uniref:DegT/DnrJ/EryC1/StrS family aminotransferase n=1 Tax=Waltera sp. TaxID=2815806 RepID=UPI003AB84174